MPLRIFIFSAFLTFFSGATVAFAAEGTDFVPIVPLPDLPTDGSVTLPQYLNQIFRLSIILGGVLAVLMIMYGGYQYMTSEAVGKKDGKDKIQSALLGLALLLFSYLIINVINPKILNLDILGPTGPTIDSQNASNFGPASVPDTVCPNGKCNGLTFQLYDENTPSAIATAKQVCSSSGGTPRDTCLNTQTFNSSGFGPKGICTNGTVKAQVCIPGKK